MQLPDSLKESTASLYAFLTPGSTQLKGTDEHLVGTQSICTVILYDIVRIYHIAT